jgi:hypothetical protein
MNLEMRVLTVVGTLGVMAVVAGGPATARPYEQLRFHDQGTYVLSDCGDLSVRIDFEDQGALVGRVVRRETELRYTVSHHGGSTITNLATGLAFRFDWNYLDQDLRSTDNGDGTVTVLTQVPGPERVFGPDGQLLATSGGTMRLELVLDYSGTLLDPTDDTLLSEELVSSNGGRPQDDTSFCDLFVALTG